MEDNLLLDIGGDNFQDNNGQQGNGQHIHGNGGQLDEEGIVTLETERAKMGEIQALPEDSKIRLFVIENLADYHPPVLFDDPTDNSCLWTEDLVREQHHLIVQTRPHLRKQVATILARLKTREEHLEEQHGNNQQQRAGFFCVFCWQRYIKNSKHSAKICREGRILRRLATNNGEQWALGNDNLDPLPQVYNDDGDNDTVDLDDGDNDTVDLDGMNADADAA